jgi:hypothetical protein
LVGRNSVTCLDLQELSVVRACNLAGGTAPETGKPLNERLSLVFRMIKVSEL